MNHPTRRPPSHPGGRVGADAATMFRLVAEAELWPAVLPGLRSARVVERAGQRRRLALATTVHGIPVSWTAFQSIEPDTGTVRFRHRLPLLRRLDVTWTIQPAEDGRICTVRIETARHASGAAPAIRLLDRWLGQDLVARLTTETFDRLRAVAEGASLAGMS